MWFLHRRRKKSKRGNRMYWVHLINQRRVEVDVFYTLFEELQRDENKFLNYFRMSISSCDELHGRLKYSLQRQNTKIRNCIQPVEMLAVTIR
jgi:energy-converting hydrogenase A subunit M